MKKRKISNLKVLIKNKTKELFDYFEENVCKHMDIEEQMSWQYVYDKLREKIKELNKLNEEDKPEEEQ